MSVARERLALIVSEFTDLDSREKLELLLDFSNNLAVLPPEHALLASRSEHRVHECQTPVYLQIELDANQKVHLFADIAPEAPTVKGFVAILAGAFDGCSCDEILGMQSNLLEQMGLADVLGILRSRGLRAIQEYIKREIVRAIEKQTLTKERAMRENA
ncbi:MAG: SufE family protein [Planctomycetota bacterium]|nr:MAG: SufE family protein [Planctomycetota bacterium]